MITNKPNITTFQKYLLLALFTISQYPCWILMNQTHLITLSIKLKNDLSGSAAFVTKTYIKFWQTATVHNRVSNEAWSSFWRPVTKNVNSISDWWNFKGELQSTNWPVRPRESSHFTIVILKKIYIHKTSSRNKVSPISRPRIGFTL